MSEYHDDEFNSFENSKQSVHENSEENFDGKNCDVDFIENHEENSFNDNNSAIEEYQKKLMEENQILKNEPNEESMVPEKEDYNPSEISSTFNFCEMFGENINYKYKYRNNTDSEINNISLKSKDNVNDSCQIIQNDILENNINTSITKGN